MKNIFKKNSIIITALAIMIVIAGYLSFTNKDAKDTGNEASIQNSDVTAVDGNEVVTDDTVKETTATDNTTNDNDEAAVDENDSDAAATDLTDTPEEDAADADTTDELGKNDISDNDALANAKDVSDNGEINLKDGTTGEAVLASTTLDSGFFVNTKLEREQKRAKDKATFMDIIENSEATSKAKEKATDGILALTQTADKESKAEMLLKTKGFDESIVFITDGKADVVVNSAGLSKQQLAIIEDVVKNATDIPAKNIKIVSVVASE